MARGKQLTDLVAQLRAETGRTQDVSIGTDEVENLKNLLRRTQEVLYDEYEWPFLRVERSTQLNAGQRYYDFPSDLNYDRLQVVKYKYGNVYTDLCRDITFDDFSQFDSNSDQRSSPALKWDVRNTGSGEQMEIWPIPNKQGSVHFFGTKTLGSLTQDSDRADLDDRLIVLFAAAEMLARQKSKDAQAKAQQADKRLLKLRANSQSNSRTIKIGQGRKNPRNTTGTQIIIGN